MPVVIIMICLCSALYVWMKKRQKNQPKYTRRQIIAIMDSYRETRRGRMRNLVAFWLFGLCNNFAYVIMLSAAKDILAQQQHPNGTDANTTVPANRTGKLVPDCNTLGTGVILLADILPTLVVKLTAPFYIHLIPYSLKVGAVILFSAASFPIVAAASSVWLSVSGVISASVGAGLGEITFLSLSSHYDRNVVSTWSSGTGMAGVAGALSYAGLTSIGLSPRLTLYIMLIVPVILAISYFVLLTTPPTLRFGFRAALEEEEDEEDCLLDKDTVHTSYAGSEGEDEEATHIQQTAAGTAAAATATEDNHTGPANEIGQNEGFFAKLNFKQNLFYITPLLKYMVPLALVYFAEYFINQALFELISFGDIWLPKVQQYRWYQVIYQIGVFISRSSVNILPINKLWIMPILQFVNLGFLLCQVLLQFVPSIWIIFAVILFEGLLGGAGYVNTFYKISKEVPDERREFSMGVASVSDSLGISLAGIVAIPTHNFICTL